MGLTELKEILTFSVLWVVFYVLENVKAKKKSESRPTNFEKKIACCVPVIMVGKTLNL